MLLGMMRVGRVNCTQFGNCDILKVVGAWKIKYHEKKGRYDEALQRDVAMIATEPKGSVDLKLGYDEAMRQLLGCRDLGAAAGGVLLFYGTEPRSHHSTPYEGLCPKLASIGLFGAG